YHGLLPN
ncbi:putative lipo domain protein, partial [Escherichia coli 8.0586]